MLVYTALCVQLVDKKLDQMQLVRFSQHKSTFRFLFFSESTPLLAFYADMLHSTWQFVYCRWHLHWCCRIGVIDGHCHVVSAALDGNT